MINRTLVRTKVVQTLFAYYYEDGKTVLSAKRDLLNAFADTYSLYMMMLDLVNEMVAEAEDDIATATERAKATHREYVPNLHFVNNRLSTQIFNNRRLRAHLEENHLGWGAAHSSLDILWKQIQQAECYKNYMALHAPSYEDDKTLWRKIITEVLADNEELSNALEELEVTLDKRNWATDANVVLSYVVKTIKRFDEQKGADQELLEMFDSEDELTFAKDLLRYAIDGREEYLEMIQTHLQNWDINRIAYMDTIILQTALAEIMRFPNIPLEISMNEYLDIANEYSSEKSHKFINGMLDSIVKDLKTENRLIKAVVLE